MGDSVFSRAGEGVRRVSKPPANGPGSASARRAKARGATRRRRLCRRRNCDRKPPATRNRWVMTSVLEPYKLSSAEEAWASKRRQGCSETKLRNLLIAQGGRCAFSGVRFVFDRRLGTPVAGGDGCHPLYPAVDHVIPGDNRGGWQLVCYDLNDLKGHLPDECFRALVETDAWKRLMTRWKEQADQNPLDREAFRRLRRPAG